MLQGLYVISNNQPTSTTNLISQADEAISGGARIFQYRNKNYNNKKYFYEAKQLQNLCISAKVPLIINDNIELALAIGAKGVHLGKYDINLRKARAILGHEKIIGVSCYNNLELGIIAQNEGANYVTFGAFFPSVTKPNATCADISILYKAKEKLNIPLVAIGGITIQNASPLLIAGADMLAVVNAISSSSNIKSTAEQFNLLFTEKINGPFS